MRPGGGKEKGSSFERLVCVRLSKWASRGKRDDIFWRSSMSGGRATIGLQKGISRKTQTGDISAIHQLGSNLIKNFLIECKSYRDLQVANFVFEKPSILGKFWDKLVKDSKVVGKIPLLIAKQNRFPIFIVTTNQFRGLVSIIPIPIFKTRKDLDIYLLDDWIPEI